MATQYDPTIFDYQNFYSAVLQSDITSGSLTLSLDTVPSVSSGILVIEPDSATNREVIFYTSKGASTITCPSDGRGWGGTTAVAHLTGSTVIMADVKSFFQGLADGTLSKDPLRTALLTNFVVSGGVVAQSAGLVGTFSDIIFYLAGRRYSGTSIANKTYTASKDTYVDITGNSDGSVSVTYTEVANNAAAPALTTNYLRIAKVVTNGSAITSATQNPNSDGIGNPFRNIGAISSNNLSNPYKFSVYRNAAWTSHNSFANDILFDTKLYDTGSNVDVTTNKGRFTAPIAGVYSFKWLAGNTSASGPVIAALYKNGTTKIKNGSDAGSSTGGAYSSGAADVQLAANDYVEVWFTGGSGSTGGTGQDLAYFDGFLISAT